ncbi:MAG: hypothetical protein ABL964_09940 [Steroidobacteraceae bacterium]
MKWGVTSQWKIHTGNEMANVNRTAPVVAPSANDPYAEAQRQQALAEALAARGNANGGRAPRTSQAALLNGLNDILAGEASRRAGERASTAKAGADRVVSDQNAALIDAMMRRPDVNIAGFTTPGKIDPATMQAKPGVEVDRLSMRGEKDPMADTLAQAIAGVDPMAVKQMLAKTMYERAMPDPSQVADRELKASMAAQAAADRKAGIEQRDSAARQASDDRRFAQEEATRRADEAARARGDQADKDRELRMEMLRMKMEQDKLKGASGQKLSSTGVTQAMSKMADMQVAKTQIQNLKDARAKLNEATDLGYILGGRQKVTASAESYDKALDALRTTIRKVTHTPGEGSMSNWEGSITQAQLPERTVWNASTLDQGISQLEDLINGYESVTAEMLGNSGAMQPPAAPTAPATPAAITSPAAPAAVEEWVRGPDGKLRKK